MSQRVDVKTLLKSPHLRNSHARPDVIRSFVLLSQTVPSEEFTIALVERLKAEAPETKLPYWCLVDCLLKEGHDEIKAQLREKVLRNEKVLMQIPWQQRDSTALYTSIVHSWVEGRILEPSEYLSVTKCIADLSRKAAAASTKGSAVVNPSAALLAERELREALQEAGLREAAEHQQHQGQAERLLIPGDSPDDGGSSDSQGEFAAAAVADADGANPVAKHVVHTPCAAIDVSNLSVPSIVAPMYELEKMCEETGRRFPAGTEMSFHKDQMFHLRTRDETVQRCRRFYVKGSDWVNTKSCLYGRHSFGRNGEQGSFADIESGAGLARDAAATPPPTEPGASGAKRKRENEKVKDPDPATTHFCAGCHEKFDKTIVDGEWYLDDCVMSMEPHPEKTWMKIRVLRHAECIEDDQ